MHFWKNSKIIGKYAILVSLLEPDSELYNAGIVDVSYAYPKMHVVRPQFFVPIIALLQNAALKTVEDRNNLRCIRGKTSISPILNQA